MELRGSYVAIATPFSQGRFDRAVFEKLINFQIDNGTAGLVPCGTTGESATLDHDEHVEVIRAAVEIADGRVPVLAGTGSNATSEAIELSKAAKGVGADAALLLTPYYNKPTQEGLYQHYKAIAEAVDLPQVIYNCPGRTAVSIAPETVLRLAELPQVVAVKDATKDLDWTSQICADGRLSVLSGDDSATLSMIALGARGVISVLANVAPRAMADLVEKALAGDHTGALETHRRYFRLMKLLFSETSPIPTKAALEMMGLMGPEIRLPLVAMTEGGRQTLRAEMQRLGLLT